MTNSLTGKRSNTKRARGFNFQKSAAIFLLIHNRKRINSLKYEGHDDIDYYLKDGTVLVAQAKSGNDANISEDYDLYGKKWDRVTEAFGGFSTDVEEFKPNSFISEFVFITNFLEPLGHDDPFILNQFCDAKEYAALTPDCKAQLKTAWLQHGLDLSLLPRLRFWHIKYEGRDKPQLNLIEFIKDFLEQIGSSRSKAETLFNRWTTLLDENSENERDVIQINRFIGDCTAVAINETSLNDIISFSGMDISIDKRLSLQKRYEAIEESLRFDIEWSNRLRSSFASFQLSSPHLYKAGDMFISFARDFVNRVEDKRFPDFFENIFTYEPEEYVGEKKDLLMILVLMVLVAGKKIDTIYGAFQDE